MKIVSIRKSNPSKVYDVTVLNNSNYILENGVISHNSGLKYSASSIAVLGKAKDKDGTEVVGNFIRVKMLKSRLSKENSEVRLKLSYKTGLDRYYGLLDLAEKHGIFKKVSTRYELPDGRKVFGKAINDNPEQYYTTEIMALLEEAAKKEFSYGLHDEQEDDDDVSELFNEPEELGEPIGTEPETHPGGTE